jgi:23S rRNA (adenine2030-N6)-methyltransferase
MFSYRHAFHAGNHADVLKHTVLIAMLRYLTEKDAALVVSTPMRGPGCTAGWRLCRNQRRSG